MAPSFHQPVLLHEVLQWLVTDPSGIYLDGTVGGGGHAAAILEKLDPTGILIGIDRDPEAVEFCKNRFRDNPNVIIIHGSFADADRLLAPHSDQPLTSVLLDLGVSSHQLDTPTRGFSHRMSGPLDMRMDPSGGTTAADILNTATEVELKELFRTLGEEKRSSAIARNLVRFRDNQPITTTDQLVEIIRVSTPPNYRIKSLSRVFQALRIYVNRELDVLEKGLGTLVKLLAPGGRLMVISYHSLEDRIAKTFFRDHSQACICPPELPQCVCGRIPDLKILTRHVVKPSQEECSHNPRARSARCRIAEKIAP
jgi:16S rRNA (cytosine1402-N4)-methyltransferase